MYPHMHPKLIEAFQQQYDPDINPHFRTPA
jgi:hypothetical protein